MKASDLTKAIEHNKSVLKELGINLINAEKGVFEVYLQKKNVKRKNLNTQEVEERDVYFVTSKCGKIYFPADLLMNGGKKVSTKLEIVDVERNPKGYITRVAGVFQ